MPIDISVIMATKGGPTKDELMIIICSITLFIEKNVTLKKIHDNIVSTLCYFFLPQS